MMCELILLPFLLMFLKRNVTCYLNGTKYERIG